MNYFGRVVDNFRFAYQEINSATLTGAIDVVVVEQPDGTFTCSPFHVRFGKLGVLRSKEKVVEIEINGKPSNIYMKLGESGEAFFVEVLEQNTTIPEHLVCSPIPYTEDSRNQQSNSELDRQDSTICDADLENTSQQVSELESATTSNKPKTFHAKTVESLSDCEVSSAADFRPIQSTTDNDGCVSSSEVEKGIIESISPTRSILTFNNNGNGSNMKLTPSKRRRKKKTVLKKKASINGDSIINHDSIDESIDGSKTFNGEESIDNTSAQEDFTQGDDYIEDEVVELNPIPGAVDLHFFSDTEVTTSVNTNHENRQQSDTEFEITNRHNVDEESVISEERSLSASTLPQAWRWGELPSPWSSNKTPNDSSNTAAEAKRSLLASMLGFMKRTKQIRQESAELDGGVYLSKLDTGELDPSVVSLYLNNSSGSESVTTQNKDSSGLEQDTIDDKDNDDIESGNGPSLAQSPSSVIGAPAGPVCDCSISEANRFRNDYNISLSLCGSLYSSDNIPSEELFTQHEITYEQFANDPAIFKNPNLVFRINNKIYKWESACPIILSLALFQKQLPENVVNRLEEDERISRNKKALASNEENKSRYRRGYYSWFTWARSRQHKSTENETADINVSSIESDIKPLEKSPLVPSKSSPALISSDVTDIIGSGMGLNTPPPTSQDTDKQKLRNYSSSSDSESEPGGKSRKEHKGKFRKTLRLTTKQIAGLTLQDGANEVMFSVTTAYQGTTRCWCTLFLWRYDDKIVVSDIDGTITKSDVLGHIMPIVGNDWAQSGVARLFNRIKDNGYQLLYLSSRAIGQSKGTRKYLCSIKQENLKLPEGPLLLNPTSLLSAFHREVIEKKPEKFKISCLRDIQALFPPDCKPFYAGYGNRINDVWAYQSVGIPIFRIFTINHRGELKHELTETFQSSYLNMSHIADQLFPVQSRRNSSEDYSQFVYWRDPLPDIEELLSEKKM